MTWTTCARIAGQRKEYAAMPDTASGVSLYIARRQGGRGAPPATAAAAPTARTPLSNAELNEVLREVTGGE